MKKHSRSLLFISALALFLSAALGLNAQSTPSTQPPDTQAQQPSTPDQTTPSQTSPSQTAPSEATPSQPTPNQTPEKSGQATPDASANSSQAGGVQSFAGTVVKSGDKYVLQDESGTTYDTDHQDEMAKFEGKRVKVHGTLDSSGKMIHIQ
jgi:cell division protein FtsN